ncbi:hypothetical protein GF380_02645 [Candidatus Uhrbacteria bacterium]|nr:hypothetical protein [Candidatus Uhrbacteria bacterium]
MEKVKRYNVGDMVPFTGAYLCIPCGYVQVFEQGEAFVPCDACQAGTSLGPEGFQDHEEDFWERMQ